MEQNHEALLDLARRVARLNPAVAEIGAGMLADLVERAQWALAEHPAPTSPTILRIRRRLERWELEHLRRLAADLSERIEQLNDRIELAEEHAQRAWEMAEFWQRHAAELQHELCAAGGQISLTPDGQLIVHTPAQEQHAP